MSGGASADRGDAWLRELAASQVFGPGDRIGTLNYLDDAARRRAGTSIGRGEAQSLARPLVPEPSFLGKGVLSVELTAHVHDHGAKDRISLECHGACNTHLDAPNHVSVDGTFYGGRSFEDAPTISEYARQGVLTRAVLADIPAVRGTPFVAAGDPVTAAEIDAALAGTVFEPGDALLCYMGRDRYEAAGRDFSQEMTGALLAGGAAPGAGPDLGRWLVEHQASLIGWDFLDIPGGGVAPLRVHRLIWAVGLAILDNCELGAAAAACRRAGTRAGALLVAPLATGGTGCMVNPLFVL